MIAYDKNWEKFLLPYRQAVDELLLKFETIKKQFYKSGEYSPIEKIYGRVKSVSSILEKSNKNNYLIEDLPIKMTDIAGVRIICQFEQDIYEVVEMIKQREDMKVIISKDYYKSPKESGYKSVHLIVSYKVHTAFGIQDVFCEIQIRTLAMDFWATIEHSLNYKYKGDIPKDVSLRLQKASLGAYELDNEMNLLREEVNHAQKLFRAKSVATNSIIDCIGLLNKLGYLQIADKYIKMFAELSEKDDTVQLVLLKKELENEISMIVDKN